MQARLGIAGLLATVLTISAAAQQAAGGVVGQWTLLRESEPNPRSSLPLRLTIAVDEVGIAITAFGVVKEKDTGNLSLLGTLTVYPYARGFYATELRSEWTSPTSFVTKHLGNPATTTYRIIPGDVLLVERRAAGNDEPFRSAAYVREVPHYDAR